jgi:hypothetical protein
MKSLIGTLVIAAAGACATTSPAKTSWNCGDQDRAVAEQGAEVHAAPDGTSPVILAFRDVQPLCAGKDVAGFGFRRVTLPDGRSGFVSEGSLQFP